MEAAGLSFPVRGAEGTLVDLAQRGQRERVGEVDGPRYVHGPHPVRVLAQLAGGEAGARDGDDDGMHGLPVSGIRDGDNCGGLDRGVGSQRVLHDQGVDGGAAFPGDDHVFSAVGEEEVSLVVLVAQVPGP